VVDANPQVRFCLAHSIAFHRGYLDRAARMDNVWVDTSAATIQVQLAREGSLLIAAGADRFDADYSDHRRVIKGLVDAYPDTILWGSDAPAYSYIVRRRQGEGPDDFEDFRLKATYEDEVAAIDLLTDEERRAVTNTNTLKFLFG
jgi:predicted TIM-barrel fold metal-dependent hydrolase